MATTTHQPERYTLQMDREEWLFLLHAIHDATWSRGIERGRMLTEERFPGVRAHLLAQWYKAERDQEAPRTLTTNELEQLKAAARGGTIELVKRQRLREAYREHNGNRKRIAAALGISERTLYRMLLKWPTVANCPHGHEAAQCSEPTCNQQNSEQ